jgi:hypothetical protein
MRKEGQAQGFYTCFIIAASLTRVRDLVTGLAGLPDVTSR